MQGKPELRVNQDLLQSQDQKLNQKFTVMYAHFFDHINILGGVFRFPNYVYVHKIEEKITGVKRYQ